ncbi:MULTISPECIES: heavy metal translocating P-type ATPase [unclassified Halomonas]|uniref:heavy metal translocating P-type ATPase n=1 Tax=unclassified Halomonas TaxID=2609666 RepID=UPI0005FA6E44|nr:MULTISPECIES: heavy metal translocating P-type ATPase [unclassified Halomonas]MCO7214041.1 heavy metal translocating P-type ATPase [Halomonas sp. OfavH-34-E]
MRDTVTRTTTLTVPGMGSDHCAGIVRKTLERLDGVGDIQTNIASHHVSVTIEAGGPDGDTLKEAVEGAGYDVAAVSGGSGKQEVRLTVPGMGSDHCAGIIRSTLERLEGVESIDTNIASHRVLVAVAADGPDGDTLKSAVEGAGYDVAAVQTDEAEDADSDAEIEEAYLSQARKRLIIAAVPTTLIMLLMMPHMFWQPIPGYLALIAVLGFPVVFLYGGIATHKSTWRSLKNGTFNMDVLISMGSLPPYLIGLAGFVYPMTSFIEMAATIMTFHLLGRYLEALAKGRASQAIRRLMTLGAKTARVERDGEEIEVSVKELAPGDIMIVRPGDKIPTDGEVVEGESHLDESIATGESIPVYKSTGDSVIGATINKEGRLRVKATRVGGDTFLSQVVRLIDQAQGSRVPIQEFADRMTGRFVPAVLAIALVSLAAWALFPDALRPILDWGATFLPWVNPEAATPVLAILAAIAVLVIACPCALGLATPTALMVGSGIGAERGILIRSGEAIQTFKDVKVMVLDKTGTITRGEPKLTEAVAAEGVDENRLLTLAASVENASEHPIARAIVDGARERDVKPGEVSEFRSTGARGVSGKVGEESVLIGNRRLLEEEGVTGLEALDDAMGELEGKGRTVVIVAADGQALGLVAVADTLKQESVEAIRGMHDLGLHVVMITGDNERAARAVAEEVGIDEVQAGVLPEGKVDAIRALQEKHGNHVAMVGDGINDAAALKQANVGIAIGAGADVAIEAADVTLVRGELTAVVDAMHLSRATFGKIVQNLIWASAYNVAAIPIAAIGLLHPMIGVIAMTTSSLSVIGNSLLLKRRYAREQPRREPSTAAQSDQSPAKGDLS